MDYLDYLDELENRSIYLIREAKVQFRNQALLWSMGKDSTTLLWLCRKAFFGKIPFPVIHIDTTFKFPEMYSYRDKWAKEWGLDLRISTNKEAISKGINYSNTDAITCCHELKTVALQKTIVEMGLDALIVGIRRDEHGVRAKERYFSPRTADFKWDYINQPAELWNHYKGAGKHEHMRVHPLLHWTELDIWRYVQREGIPVNELYFAKNGKRYRSLGCMPITKPVDSTADSIENIVEELEHTTSAERAGRDQDKENYYAMQKLRALGYM